MRQTLHLRNIDNARGTSGNNTGQAGTRSRKKGSQRFSKHGKPTAGPKGFLHVAQAAVKTHACTFPASTESIYQDNINAYRRIPPKPSDTHRLIAPFAQRFS